MNPACIVLTAGFHGPQLLNCNGLRHRQLLHPERSKSYLERGGGKKLSCLGVLVLPTN